MVDEDDFSWRSQSLILSGLPTSGISNAKSETLFSSNAALADSFFSAVEQKKLDSKSCVDQSDIKNEEWPFPHKRRIRNQLLPPEGLLPITAADVFRFKNSLPISTTDRCLPVEYQKLPQDAELQPFTNQERFALLKQEQTEAENTKRRNHSIFAGDQN